MCYPKPRPRCSTHAKKRLRMLLDNKHATNLDKAIAYSDYRTSPAGIAALQQELDKEEFEYWQSIRQKKEERARKLRLLMLATQYGWKTPEMERAARKERLLKDWKVAKKQGGYTRKEIDRDNPDPLPKSKLQKAGDQAWSDLKQGLTTPTAVEGAIADVYHAEAAAVSTQARQELAALQAAFKMR